MTIDTDHGPVDAKEVTTPSGRTRLKVEHDALWAFSRKAGLSAGEAAERLRNAGGEGFAIDPVALGHPLDVRLRWTHSGSCAEFWPFGPSLHGWSCPRLTA